MAENQNNANNYSASNIQVLEGLEAVRKRPAMYIGDISEKGLHHLVNETVDNSIDEAMAGYCTDIEVTINEDNSITVEDNGRGIPVDMHEKLHKSALEVVMTVLHAGGKFDKGSYKVSGGLHGVGVSCVNALSTHMLSQVFRGGKIYQQEYEKGKPLYPVKVVGETNKRGTRQQFWPDPTIFTHTVYKWDIIANRMRELAFLNAGIKITLKDLRPDEEGKTKEQVFHAKDGLKEFVRYVDRHRTHLFDDVIYLKTEKQGIPIEIAVKELRGTEWYGEYATLTDEHNDYVQIEYKCNGTGRLYDYTLFPGIDLIFMDFNCSDTFHEPIPNKNIIEIRHYQKGRVEFELRNNKVFHMKEGEFCINALANIPAAYSFPFGYSVGLSCVIDKDSVDVETQQIFSYYNMDVLNLGRELELEKKWFLCRTPQRLLHIFEELYAAKGVEERDYFRIKLLELFYHIKQLRIEDQYEATYYAKEQIEIIKRIRQQLIENLDKKISIEELLRKEPMSKVTFQAIFKQIYGDTPYAHIKKYKMNLAAVYLQETDQSITQIAGELGYSNISKFARAFQEVFGMLPKDYRKAKKVI